MDRLHRRWRDRPLFRPRGRSQAEPARRPSIGLVLGGGGMVGQAYHAGALAALERHWGWDPRDAAVVVGTSAGSLTGGFLRLGVPTADLAAWWSNQPVSPEMFEIAELIGERPAFEPLRWVDLVRVRATPRSVVEAARALIRAGPRAAGLALARVAATDVQAHLSFLDAVGAGRWPDRSFWVCVVRRRDGRRVVLGRPDAPATDLLPAISASCAVPGYFTAVTIDGDEYVDGGAHTPTNADVLADTPLDLVVVVAPMSARGAVGRDLSGCLRLVNRRMLRREAAVLARNGTPVITIEPGPDVRRAMGDDLMAEAVVAEVTRTAFDDTAAQLAAADPTPLSLVGNLPIERRRAVDGSTRRRSASELEQLVHDLPGA